MYNVNKANVLLEAHKHNMLTRPAGESEKHSVVVKSAARLSCFHLCLFS